MKVDELQRYDLGTIANTGQKTMYREKHGRFVLYSDAKAIEEEKDEQIAALKKVLVNGVLKDHDACVIYQDEEYTKLEVKYYALTAERDKLKAILKEQEEIVCGVGPITCRNGVVHERDDDSDCFYCQMDRIKTENKQLREALGRADGVLSAPNYAKGIIQEALRGGEVK
uniref:Uncharacterized protein n=1 Tax=viral metagenome TaxID=1070528 RepID=A0A6H1ZHK0_9ZZZZ